jgi:DNA-directed RNA polymerase alpha subunit
VVEFPLAVSRVRVPDAGALYELIKWAESHQPELATYLRLLLRELAEVFEWPIEELDLSDGAYIALKREKPDMKICDLTAKTEDDLMDIRGLRHVRVKEIKVKLAGLGLTLKQIRGIAPA